MLRLILINFIIFSLNWMAINGDDVGWQFCEEPNDDTFCLGTTFENGIGYQAGQGCFGRKDCDVAMIATRNGSNIAWRLSSRTKPGDQRSCMDIELPFSCPSKIYTMPTIRCVSSTNCHHVN